MKSRFTVSVCLLMVLILIVGLFSGCSAKAADLMDGIEAETVTGKEADDDFKNAHMNFAVELFKASVKSSKDENTLISPISAQLVLAMVMNGAEGQTLQEMETVLGMPRDDLNKYLYSFIQKQDSDALTLANSIWIRNQKDRLTVEKDFLQTNANYYAADIFSASFGKKTVGDINEWVSKKTDGNITDLIDSIEDDQVMILINALLFDKKWKDVYTDSDVKSYNFTSIKGDIKKVEMLVSDEHKYLTDDGAVGVMKDYAGGKYSFAALLPDEGMSINDYISGLTAERLQNILNNAKDITVKTRIPKFKYDYSINLNNALISMGMPTAFDGENADFSSLGKSKAGNIRISEVTQNTFITLNENGTKAGAVTKAVMTDSCDIYIDEPPEVYLDRPFIYMIVDNETNLPIFIGTVTNIE